MPELKLLKPQINVDTKSGNWVWFPGSLPGGRFRAFENREDETQLQGAWVLGQNVKFRKSGLPSLREGSAVLGTEQSDTNEVRRAFTFETRNGDQFEVKILGNGTVKYWFQGVSTDWVTLQTGLTADLEYGYAVIDETSDKTNSVFYGNGTDSWYRWTAAYAYVSSVTGTTVTITGSDNFDSTAVGFSATGSIMVNGTSYTYSGGTGTTTMTGIADTTGIVAGDLIVQAPITVTYTDSVSIKSSVMMPHDGRIHFRDDAKKNVWYYTTLDNPDDITNLGTGTDGYANKKAVETGGPITAFGKMNKTILCFKKRVIKMLDFTQSSTRIDVPFYRTLIPADDKGTTLGALNQKSTIATPYGTVFITPDKRLVLLTGITQNDEPQYLVLSDPIQPIFDAGDHRSSTAICVNNVLRYAFKSSPDASENDVELTGDMTRQTFDRVGRILPIEWDTPNVGRNINDYTAIQDSNGKTVVHYHSSLNSNSYEVLEDDKTDGGGGFVATVRSWSEYFGQPELWKVSDLVCVVIKMKQNSSILTSFLFDENGVTSIYEKTLLGTYTQYRYSAEAFNPFGANEFGSQKFGSNPENAELNVYRFFLEIPTAVKFFNVALQLSGDIDGNDFELIRFGYRIKEVLKTTPRTLKLQTS